ATARRASSRRPSLRGSRRSTRRELATSGAERRTCRAVANVVRNSERVHGVSTLYDRLDRGDLILRDGAMGTMLPDVRPDDGGAPELWNVERADPVAEILAAYAEAGAQYLTTNTFGGTAPRLQLHGLEDRVEELSRAGAGVARGVADRVGILVAGDIGPTG